MTTDNIFNLELIARALEDQRPKLLPPDNRGHAAVAMLLRERKHAPEALFIIRAVHDQDPWSGNIGFPGGRLNPGGESPRQAAERETFEELALDLSQARFLGRLNDLYGMILPVLVSCFVYQLFEPTKLQPNHEVAKTFWCPLTKLLEPERQQTKNFIYRGEERTHSVIELLEPQQPLLWGITYRLIGNFFELCGHNIGTPGSTKTLFP